MSTKHAPKPWYAILLDDGNMHIKDADGITVCVVALKAYTHAIGMGNTSLIESAPNLLTALEEITQEYVDLLDSGDCGNGGPAEDWDEVRKARAAIAQAKAKW